MLEKRIELLVVEDDPGFGYILREYLELNDIRATLVTTAETALKRLANHHFDLCLLDIMLPDMDGFALAKTIQNQMLDIPFIFLTAKALKVDKLKGFRLGCDDYIVKPIDEELLIARIQAIIHRSARNQGTPLLSSKLMIGDFSFDPQNQLLTHKDKKQYLTDMESRLLHLFCQSMPHLLSRRKALLEVWGSSDEFSRKSMDVFIFRLRKYLEKDPRVQIRNIHGKGFILEVG